MSESVVSQVTVVSKNEVSESDKERLMSNNDFDSFEDYAKSLEDDLESVIAHKLFGDADEIPILDVNVSVEQ